MGVPSHMVALTEEFMLQWEMWLVQDQHQWVWWGENDGCLFWRSCDLVKRQQSCYDLSILRARLMLHLRKVGNGIFLISDQEWKRKCTFNWEVRLRHRKKKGPWLHLPASVWHHLTSFTLTSDNILWMLDTNSEVGSLGGLSWLHKRILSGNSGVFFRKKTPVVINNGNIGWMPSRISWAGPWRVHPLRRLTWQLVMLLIWRASESGSGVLRWFGGFRVRS